jgi:hypothetical protein
MTDAAKRPPGAGGLCSNREGRRRLNSGSIGGVEPVMQPTQRRCRLGRVRHTCCGRVATRSPQLGEPSAPCSCGDAKPLRDYIAGQPFAGSLSGGDA